MKYLAETMTFDQLFRYSEPGRVKRSGTVRGPPLEITGGSDAMYHAFNFKSYPSTTGLRHHGYIKFIKPELMRPNTPLQHIPCQVDCSCPDLKFRFAFSNMQRGAGRIGPQSLNKCINRAPRITNPANIPGLCVAENEIVSTRRGLIPIQQVSPSDEVWTLDGWQQLSAAARTGTKAIVEVRAISGRKLRVTPNHKVLAFSTRYGLQWIEAQHLNQSHRLCITFAESHGEQFFDAVDTVVAAGTANVYDLTVNDKVSHFTVNGAVVHNCKHILAARDYIYGMKAKFFPGEPDTGETLAKMVKYATTRWADFPGHMAKAKDQEKWFRAVKDAVSAGRAGDMDYIHQLYQQAGGTGIGVPHGIPQKNAPASPQKGPEPPPENVPPLPQRQTRAPRGPRLPRAGRPTLRPEPELPTTTVKPPELPAKAAKPTPPSKGKTTLPSGVKGKTAPPGKRNKPKPPRSEALQTILRAHVDRVNGSSNGANQITESMSQLKDAIKLIEEVEADEVKAPREDAGEMAPPAADNIDAEAPPPSEPPVEDTAIGADTEGNVVLQLLADIRKFLAMLVGAEENEGELPPGEEEELADEGEAPPMPPEDGGEDSGPVDAIPEPDEEDEEDEEEDYGEPNRGPKNPEAE